MVAISLSNLALIPAPVMMATSSGNVMERSKPSFLLPYLALCQSAAWELGPLPELLPPLPKEPEYLLPLNPMALFSYEPTGLMLPPFMSDNLLLGQPSPL